MVGEHPMTQSLIQGVGLSGWQKMHRRARGRAWPIKVGGIKPPACPPGWVLGPPDFVGVGAQRAGTSWWFGLIQGHPQVDSLPGVPKELHFFDPFWWRHFDRAALEEYRCYFPRRPGHLAGEWTPRYMHDAWTPSLLRAAAPGAKILAILRDPIDRYVSGLAFDLARGAPVHEVVASDAFNRGLYGRQLSHLTRLFDRSNLLVLQYERCVTETAHELARTFEFLQLDSHQSTQVRAEQLINATYRDKPRLMDQELETLVDAYEDDVLRLTENFPEIDLTLWPRFSHLTAGRSAI
jgi:sulfotransferase family protein